MAARQPGRLAAAAAIVLIAFNLRPALSSLAPVLNEVMADTGLTASGAALLTTAPVLCLGLFGPLGPALARRIGAERTALLATLLVAIGCLLRGEGSVALLMGGSLLAGVGIAMGNVLLPAVLKHDFADRTALMTGLYAMALCLGAAVASGVTAPLRHALGDDWRAALGLWAVPALGALAFAALVWRDRADPGPAARRPAGRLWRDALAWQVTLFMGLQSMLAYSVFGWLAPILRGRGDSAVVAGAVVSVSVLAQTVAAMGAPLLAGRLRRQSWPAAASMALTVGSFLLLIGVPLGWQWALSVTLGLGMGAAFSLAVMMIVLRSPDGPTAGALSSMAQSVGYTIAAGGPLLVGVLHDAWGDWSGAAGLFVVAGGTAGMAGFLAGRARTVRAAGRV